MALTRRQFLKWAGATGIGAVVFNGCAVPEREIVVQSSARLPEDLASGRDNFYATTAQLGPASEGVLVRVMEGRAKKVEGNPDFPLNAGKHSARAEALLQALYHPDRMSGPLERVGRGGPWRTLTWDGGLQRLVDALKSTDPKRVVFATAPYRGELASVVTRFATAYGAKLLGYEPLEQTALREATRRLTGSGVLPDFDIARSRFVLGFGADFLGTWLAPTHFARGYGEFRSGASGKRGTFIHVDARYSTTAVSADDWVAVRPGSEGLLALSIAYVMVREGLADTAASSALTGGQGARALDAYAPNNVVAQIAGSHRGGALDADAIVRIARAFADPANRPAVAIGGGSAAAHTNGTFNVQAILALNYLAGSVNKPGGMLLNPATHQTQVTATPLRAWAAELARMREGEVDVLVVRDADLLHGLPGSLDAARAISRVKKVVSLSSFLDETTAAADLVLPASTGLEEWGTDTPDPGPGYGLVGLQQPVVTSYRQTLAFGDILLRAAKDLGLRGEWPQNMRDAVRTTAQALHRSGGGSVRAPTFEEFWRVALQRGGWWDQAGTVKTVAAPPALPARAEAEFTGNATAYPFYLVPFEPIGIGTGMAHLPWLQAAPDPVTTMAWQTWVEVNPRTAASLDLKAEDVVIVESSTGRTLEAVVYVNPAAPPQVLGVPFGQGHRQFTQYAAGRGANVADILAPAEDKDTGAWAWAATRVRLVKTRKRLAHAKLEGTEPAVEGEEKIIEVLRVSSRGRLSA